MLFLNLPTAETLACVSLCLYLCEQAARCWHAKVNKLLKFSNTKYLLGASYAFLTNFMQHKNVYNKRTLNLHLEI